jgi:hypothetical protein
MITMAHVASTNKDSIIKVYLEYILKLSRNAFENFRYAYEGIGDYEG